MSHVDGTWGHQGLRHDELAVDWPGAHRKLGDPKAGARQPRSCRLGKSLTCGTEQIVNGSNLALQWAVGTFIIVAIINVA